MFIISKKYNFYLIYIINLNMKKKFEFITYYTNILTCIINKIYKPTKLCWPRKYTNEIYSYFYKN